jgi:hypothetical protein
MLEVPPFVRFFHATASIDCLKGFGERQRLTGSGTRSKGRSARHELTTRKPATSDYPLGTRRARANPRVKARRLLNGVLKDVDDAQHLLVDHLIPVRTYTDRRKQQHSSELVVHHVAHLCSFGLPSQSSLFCGSGFPPEAPVVSALTLP